MGCEHKEGGRFHHLRQPQQTPSYRLVEWFNPQFEVVYADCYQERYGFGRPIIGTVVKKFLECGHRQRGFAQVRCPKCAYEFFVAYSCRGRCFCPSCHQKQGLQTALWV